MAELKPCPFCGGQRPYTANFSGKMTVVCCDDCGVTAAFYRQGETTAVAIKAWNKRAKGTE